MDCYIGIDLGSTTTKAIYLDQNEQILGKGITNSRSNYTLACEIAEEEAGINSRFVLLRKRLMSISQADVVSNLMDNIYYNFLYAEHVKQLKQLRETCKQIVDKWPDSNQIKVYQPVLDSIFDGMQDEAAVMFRPGQTARSDFFRDIASSQYLSNAEKESIKQSLSYDRLTGIYDRAILLVEGNNFSHFFKEYLDYSSNKTLQNPAFKPFETEVKRAVEYAMNLEFNVINTIGTGYGRQTLPFPKHQIRSEILCHGLGAHYMFPDTRTVLDIGGQDTKAIQVDGRGIVTSFQMNDRCAAGCGRYLGYIADEMSIGVHELGPMAQKSCKPIRINSTCTVFAGAELRERLALGDKREDILLGLHRAIVLRAMSLLARSGGIKNEFTFTGGVAKNAAVVDALNQLVLENYGEVKTNISPDSIYTGALGACLFAKNDKQGEVVNVDLRKLRKKRA